MTMKYLCRNVYVKVRIMKKRNRKMQYIGFLMFVIGAAGIDGPNITIPVVMVLGGLGILAVSALREQKGEWYDTASITSQRYSRNVPDIRKQSLCNNKAA